MIPAHYSFVHKTKIIHGKLALEQIPIELEQNSAWNPLVITDSKTPRSRIKKLVSAFARSANPISVFDRVGHTVEENTIREIAGVYREAGADSILALGGTSVIDTAKGANILVSKGNVNFADIQGRDTLSGRMRPVFAIPTLIKSRTSINKNLQISSGPDIYSIESPVLMPTGVVTDPRMMISNSKQAIAGNIAATLFRAIEPCTGPEQNPACRAYAHASLDILRAQLNGKVRKNNNKKVQADIANANILADMAMSNTRQGLGIAISQAIGEIGNAPGDVAAGLILPELMKMRANEDSSLESISKLLQALVGPETYASTPVKDRPQEAIKTVEGIIANLHKYGGKELSKDGLGISSRMEEISSAVANNTRVLGNEAVTKQKVMDMLKTM